MRSVETGEELWVEIKLGAKVTVLRVSEIMVKLFASTFEVWSWHVKKR